MAKTVIGVFGDTSKAEKAVDDLQRKGFRKDEISILARENVRQEAGGGRGGEDRGQGDRGDRGMTMGAGQDLSTGVYTGGAVGGLAGLLASAGALAIPGIGPILAAGPVAAALTGAVTGGIAGGLIDWGIPENVGRRYEERVKEGKIVALVRTDDDKVSEAADVMRRHGATEVETH
ncbi:MAG TPA: hypothetical protein GX510_01540 [Firmicutes bacterium]|nr:hypothetical protein [Candidatus Fermentithermobacillaceae bacterium]